jgi:hypothetical protein
MREQLSTEQRVASANCFDLIIMAQLNISSFFAKATTKTRSYARVAVTTSNLAQSSASNDYAEQLCSDHMYAATHGTTSARTIAFSATTRESASADRIEVPESVSEGSDSPEGDKTDYADDVPEASNFM